MHHGKAAVQAAHAEFTTGTPLFTGLNVLRKKSDGVIPELSLETLMYVLIFTLSGVILPWHHMESTSDDRNLT